MDKLQQLRDMVFEMDNHACFIEKERIIQRLVTEMKDYDKPDKHAIWFATILDEVSTPLYDCDYFAGRIVEALPDEGMEVPSYHLCATGHMSFDYETVLREGFSGILHSIQIKAEEKNTTEAREFVHNAEIVVEAVRRYALRYARVAEEKGFTEMARALSVVPYEPAYDFYSALQSIWLIHMIASCYMGGRDYAFGRFDQYMLPYYEQALREGKTKEEITALLAGFFMKTNEICGRTAHNYNRKPTLAQSSNQYINMGGEHPNAFSFVILDAAERSNMAQPIFTVLLKPDADEIFTTRVFKALSRLTDKMNIYNYELVLQFLLKKGIPAEIAKEFTYSACCTFDLNYHTQRMGLMEDFLPSPQLFVEAMHEKSYASVDELLSVFRKKIHAYILAYAERAQKGVLRENRHQFLFDSLLLTDTAREAQLNCNATSPFNAVNIFFMGLATIGDSLMVLDKLVFREKRYKYEEFMEILKKEYEGHEALRAEILQYTKFGNDTDIDAYTVKVANTFIDVTESIPLRDNFFMVPGFYSLHYDNWFRNKVSATPDGRRSGEPFSENQSPTYGADKNGITALFKSLSKLPFDKTATGGLNLTFSQKASPDILQALILSYFSLGGLHVGISTINRETLLEAMKTPEKYKSLTVRLYGFSEYFISLAECEQISILNRTEYQA